MEKIIIETNEDTIYLFVKYSENGDLNRKELFRTPITGVTIELTYGGLVSESNVLNLNRNLKEIIKQGEGVTLEQMIGLVDKFDEEKINGSERYYVVYVDKKENIPRLKMSSYVTSFKSKGYSEDS